MMKFNEINIQDLQLKHDLQVNPISGSVSSTINVPVPVGRNGFAPNLTLRYTSSAPNSPFGIGWALSGLPFISISTKKGLPKFDGTDTYAFNGDVLLVPQLLLTDNKWQQRIDETATHWIYYFRANIEDYFIRFEKWINKADYTIHWRSISADNVVSVYGLHNARIYNPEKINNTLVWLIDSQYDNLGNAILYKYKSEDVKNIDALKSSEISRIRKANAGGFAQKYPECILYGNLKPLLPDEAIPIDNKWLFEVVFDYGEYDNRPYENNQPIHNWNIRLDPFSVYNGGFEIRTYRLCKRILTYHHIAELSTKPSLTGIFDCNYDENVLGTTLNKVVYTGVRRDLVNGTYSEKQLPALSFTFTKPALDKAFQASVSESNINVPQGFNHYKTQFIDLFGDGLPGILTENSSNWYYKANLGGGKFDKQEIVIEKPSQDMGVYVLKDFDNDGNINLFSLQGRTAGYYEYDRHKNTWSGFNNFLNIPQVPNAKFIDINADGFADLIVEKDDSIVCYLFEGKEGFGQPTEFSKPSSNDLRYTPTVGDNPALDYFMADMTGDGLPDQVSIKSGRVEYYPNLGNGRFGEVVLMENSPLFDFDNEFDASRIRLHDLDGNGTADIIYLGRGELRYWYNAYGNSFVEGGTIYGLPYIDILSSAMILDYLGNGTPCLIWSNSLSYALEYPLQYLGLTNGIIPNLLIGLDNGIGKETKIEYGYSGNHYLESVRNGQAWVSKIPSHFPVADRKIIIDHISNSQLTTIFKYFDGHYDGNERRFVCFGRVEEFDTEGFNSNHIVVQSQDFTQPKCTKTWFHSGMFGWHQHHFSQFYNKDTEQPHLLPQAFEQSDALESNDFVAGYRSLAGRMVRQEIYATEDGIIQENPFTVSQRAYTIRYIQPHNLHYEACFFCYQSEAIEIAYDQQPNDPKTTHHLLIEVDNYGNTTKDVSIAYGRRNTAAEFHTSQLKDCITAGLYSFVNKDIKTQYQLHTGYEKKIFEINQINRNTNEIVKWIDAKTGFDNWLTNAIPFDQMLPNIGNTVARLTDWQRTYFWNDGSNAVLPLGQVGSTLLIHHQEIACFNDALIQQVFNNKVSQAMLTATNEGNYSLKENYWWQSTPINHFKPLVGFYLLEKTEKQTANITLCNYDNELLTIVETIDAVGNKIAAEIDYNLLKPYKLIDANDNVSEVLYDALGVVVVSSSQGEVLHNNLPQKYGHGLIEQYIRRNDESIDNIIANPDLYIQQAATYLFYDFTSRPLRSVQLVRENLFFDGKGNTNHLATVQIKLSYQDGLGRAIQQKQKVEDGLAIQRDANNTVILNAKGEPILAPTINRWLATGHVVYNNKQLPIRKFEPYFSDTPLFEIDEVLETYGISTQNYYDALGRNYRTDFADGTFAETVFNPWEVKVFDQNDTVNRSLYKTIKEIQPAGTTERMALDKTLAHKETPTILKFDALGRPIVSIATNNNTTIRKVENQIDIKGNPIAIVDARNLKAFEYKRDMRGRVLYEKSIDAGEKWSFYDSLDQLIHTWDGRNIHQRTHYDSIGRPLSRAVDGALGLNQLTERFVYGDDPSIQQAKEKNLRGNLAKHYDQAGLQELKVAAPGGMPLEVERKLLAQYTTEPNWTNIATVALEPTTYTSRYNYDAIGRVIEQQLPDQTTRNYIFNEIGGVKNVLISTADGVLNNVEILKNATYDAKNMRQTVRLGNDVEVEYSYAADTFRMTQLKAKKTTGNTRLYQDIRYTYDPVGNLIYLIDEAQQPTAANPQLLTGLNVSAHAEYQYDALYQLISASGRVHQALLQNDYADRSRETNVPPNWSKGTRHITLNNGAAVERYTQTYQYDEAGNIKTIQHNGITQSWTNQIWTSATSNRSLPLLDFNGVQIANPENRFDANGNCIYMPHLRSIEWNYRNNISKAVVIDRTAQGKPNDEEYYVYDGNGIRIRKITQRVVDVANNTIELTEKIYLDGCELKKITRGGVEILHRKTSKLNDGTHKIAIIHAWEKDNFARETDDITKKKIHYQLANHLGSASLEIDENGDIISYEEYFPHGRTAFIAGRNKRDIDLKDYRYSGKEHDDFTGLYYFGYRYYAHWIGGWINPDPLGPEDSENLYLYVQNNPINVIDPNGLQSTELPETDATVTGTFNDITDRQRELLTQRTPEALATLNTELNEALTAYFGEGYFAWHTTNGNWMWVEGVAPQVSEGEIGPSVAGAAGENEDSTSTAGNGLSCEGEDTSASANVCEMADGASSEGDVTIGGEGLGDDPNGECNSSPCGDEGQSTTGDDGQGTVENPVYIIRIIVQEGARPTAGSVFQEARNKVGSPRTFTPGEPLQGPYNLWSNEPGGGLLDAANKPGYIMEDTVLEDLAERIAIERGYPGGRYDPNLRFGNPNFVQADFDAVWNPTSDSLAIRAGTSMTPVTSNGLEPWRTPPHPNPSGTVQMSREIPHIVGAGGLMGQFAKVSGIITIVVANDIDNQTVRVIGMTAGATEFVGGTSYMLGAADLGGGYFGANGATRLMTFGSGAARAGGGVGMIVMSGYSASVHIEQGEYGLLVSDASGAGLGTMILTGTASGPAVALTGTAMGANYLGDYVESKVTPELGREAGVVTGTGAGLAAGGVVGGGLVALGLVSNPVGWGILAVGGIAGFVGAMW